MDADLCPSEFTYRRLATGQIRLLRILEREGRRLFELPHVEFASAPKYSTLSYTWDDQSRDQDLLIGGSILKVISNIKIVLPYLFEDGDPQHFWIDGICINQDDDEEKDVQVPLMQKIYSQSAKGIVWLGEGNRATETAIPEIPVLTTQFQTYDYRLGFDGEAFLAHGLPKLSSPVWQGLNDLFARGWFTRVWTFQEAVLPEVVEFRCGHQTIGLDHIALLARNMLDASLSGSVDSLTDHVDYRTRLIQGGMQRAQLVQDARTQWKSADAYNFLDLLYDAWEWSCSDSSDHIYGLLGLADEELQQSMTIDYSKTPEEVYLEFFKSWIPRDHHLSILHMSSRSNKFLELPSFCPNFNEFSTATMLMPFAHRQAEYRAGIQDGKKAKAYLSHDSKQLHVEGFLIDEIDKVLPCPWERNANISRASKSESIAESLTWERRCLHLSQLAYNSPDEVPDAHWRTLIANKNAEGLRYSSAGDGRNSYHMLRIVLSSLTETDVPFLPAEYALAAGEPFSREMVLETQALGEAFGYASHGRSFFTTRGGRIGLGPLDTELGDRICIFNGARTPFVLRPVDGGRYELVGETYVDGVMYGEISETDGRVDEVFMLV